MLCQLSYAVKSVQVDDISELSLVSSISVYFKIRYIHAKVAGSIATVAKQTFQLARCGCTLRVTSCTNIILKRYS